MRVFLIRLLIQTLALLVVGYTVPGIHVDSLGAAIVAALIFGVVNAIVRPLLFVLTLPITVLTLGLFILILNGLCLGLTAYLVQGFSISGLFPAIVGSLVMALVGWLLNLLIVEPRTQKGAHGIIDVKAKIIR